MGICPELEQKRKEADRNIWWTKKFGDLKVGDRADAFYGSQWQKVLMEN